MRRPPSLRLAVAVLARLVAILVAVALIGATVTSPPSQDEIAAIEALEELQPAVALERVTVPASPRAPVRIAWSRLTEPSRAPARKPPVPPPRA